MGGKQSSVYSVTQLNAMIKERLETDRRFADCYVLGEISNFKRHSSNHLYFTLKDETSRIRAVMFSSRARFLKFLPEDGMRVVIRGTISVFDRDGQVQVYVDEMQPDGIGALYVAFTQLRDKLEAEGLFAASRKRALPVLPRRIGVVTSPTGAVIRDIYSTLKRRYPHASIILAPASVQGVDAAATLVRGLQNLVQYSRTERQIDVVIMARGGGSLEELWPFNEEVVARAVAASPIPVVSAVGHETDFTICDFVADVRAATPTAAAELVAPQADELRSRFTQLSQRAYGALRWRLTDQRQRLLHVRESVVLTQPTRLLNARRQHVDFLESGANQSVIKPVQTARKRLAQAVERLYRIDVPSRVIKARSKLDAYENHAGQAIRGGVYRNDARLERILVALEALNPLTVLRRGYSVVYRMDKDELITAAHQVRYGEHLRIRMSDGTLVVRSEGENKGDGKQSRLDL